MPSVDEVRASSERLIAPLNGKKARKSGNAEPDLMAALELYTGLCINIAKIADKLAGS